ncbi:hypothetical protein CSX04_06262 [Burkholderia cepacia]|nr:hypothetical protein CSX04_06262 [Burkholderia cepacia]
MVGTGCDVPLSDLLPSDALTVNAELSRAWISGSVEDAQARFNLTNLVSRAAPGKPWQSNGEGVLAYRRLLGQLSLDPALAQPTADYMLRSLRDTNGPGGWPLQLVSVDDLARIPGYDAHAVAALAPFVTILPDLTVVNANTAPEPVLVAAIPTLSASQARRSSTGAPPPTSSAPATSPNTCCPRRAATRRCRTARPWA